MFKEDINMLLPKIYKTVFLSDILGFLKNIYGDTSFDWTYERSKLIESMGDYIYINYTKEMFKDKNVEINSDIREMREEGILPKEFVLINDLG